MNFKEWLTIVEGNLKFVNYLSFETYSGENDIYLKYSLDPKGQFPVLSDPIIKVRALGSDSGGRLEPVRLGGWFEVITGNTYDGGQVEITGNFKIFAPNQDANTAISLLSHKKRHSA